MGDRARLSPPLNDQIGYRYLSRQLPVTFSRTNISGRVLEFTGPSYAPFKSNNMSGTIGGPIIPHHHSFFFFAIEPLRSTFFAGNQSYTFEDPQFVQWAVQNFPGTVGTQLLQKYPIKPTSSSSVAQTADDIFPVCAALRPHRTSLAACPWSIPERIVRAPIEMGCNGTLESTSTGARTVSMEISTAWCTTINRHPFEPTWMVQTTMTRIRFDETHTFNSNILNEAVFGYLRVRGIVPNRTVLFRGRRRCRPEFWAGSRVRTRQFHTAQLPLARCSNGYPWNALHQGRIRRLARG